MNQDDLIRMNKVLRHRLRNSASGLKTSVSFLSKELADRLSPAEMEYFPLILNECDAITHLTDRMQLFIDPPPPAPPATLAEILTQLVDQMKRLFPTAPLRFDGDPEAVNAVIIDKNCLLIPLTDLLINAIEAAPSQQVLVSCTNNETMLTIQITDQGQGMTALEMDPFLPFFTTKTRHLGLGLGIARKRIEYLSGSINVVPTPSGTTAEVQLPRSPDATDTFGIIKLPPETLSNDWKIAPKSFQ